MGDSNVVWLHQRETWDHRGGVSYRWKEHQEGSNQSSMSLPWRLNPVSQHCLWNSSERQAGPLGPHWERPTHRLRGDVSQEWCGYFKDQFSILGKTFSLWEKCISQDKTSLCAVLTLSASDCCFIFNEQWHWLSLKMQKIEGRDKKLGWLFAKWARLG